VLTNTRVGCVEKLLFLIDEVIDRNHPLFRRIHEGDRGNFGIDGLVIGRDVRHARRGDRYGIAPPGLLCMGAGRMQPECETKDRQSGKSQNQERPFSGMAALKKNSE
jgi:hypothetical protein